MLDVEDGDLRLIKQILKKHVPDAEVRAFGSRVLGNAKDYSDLDLAVFGVKKLDFAALGNLKMDFEESCLPFRVDILDWLSISPEFQKIMEIRYEIVQNGLKGC